MNLVFAGTPQFAATILASLLDAGHHVRAVYTQPDRPAGRGRRPAASAVKRLALERGLDLRQPRTLRDAEQVALLGALAPEAMVVAAYGLLLPRPVLEVPSLGCINVHASLLPRWRGAAPIQRAILAGDTETGVCIMRMEEGLDTGPVLAERRCAIGAEDTAGSLHERLARLGAEALLEVLPRLADATAMERPQDDARATTAPRIDKTETRLDWRRSAAQLERQVRAFHPAPGAWAALPQARSSGGPEARLRVLRARPLDAARSYTGAPGEVVVAGRDALVVACGTGALELLEVQPAGRRAMTARDFLNARGLTTGDVLR